jgi:hypothetical protein
MANTHEHLEHAEHAEHNAHDPFNQRVAVSMAIVAAILAAISMVGHRTHNKVLQLQGESNRLLGDVNRVLGDVNRIGGEAASAEIDKSNLFAWYQSKRQRQALLQLAIETAEDAPTTNEEARKKKLADWAKKVKEYNESNRGTPKSPEGDNLPDLERRGNEAGKRAEQLRAEAAAVRGDAAAFRKEAAEKSAEAEHVHHQADRFDIAHLSAELGLVLCSIALLTRNKAYWFTGLAAAVIAVGLTASGYTIPRHEAGHPDSPAHTSPADAAPAHPAPAEKDKPH